ncbi:peroxidase 2-like [Cucumis sativus]|uniref:Peroxidase n=1 Tax=Cucumis sativus TaxID=3659 RepID=A0A0A0KKW1_CUCSA|nr:peroxidase 2-like [Cucumis sativus]
MAFSKALPYILLITMLFTVRPTTAQLCPSFYDTTCPNLPSIVEEVVRQALQTDARAGAKLIRFHFHDCFVNGCDGSVLLEDSVADGIDSEQNAPGNLGIQGQNIVADIKTAVENACPNVVSCADILAIASNSAVVLAGGRGWEVQLGRRDSRIANRSGAVSNLPSPFEPLANLTVKFANVGLNSTDLVSLSGAHTFGQSRCRFFQGRLSNFSGTGMADPSLDPIYRDMLLEACPQGGDNNRVNLDPTTPNEFDNNYFTNLQDNRGLLTSDQVLFSPPGAATTVDVDRFAASQEVFFDAFGASMIKMGNIMPLTTIDGEIRLTCSRINPLPTLADM